MHIIHISFECYPVAKAGGLADVVGSLPKYMDQFGVRSWVVMPHFDLAWTREHTFREVHAGTIRMGHEVVPYNVLLEENEVLGYPLYTVNIPGRLDRPGIYIDPESDYPYWDEYERFISFQVAVLDWINSFREKPDLIHCHDHHTSMVPFLMTSSHEFQSLASIPTVLTIHNANYQGWYHPDKQVLLPAIIPERAGLMYWNGQINTLSAGIRTAWWITTVSESYLVELQESCKGLESLLQNERDKSSGIINGIDTEVWNPASDPYLAHHYHVETVVTGKKRNKEWLCDRYQFDTALPLFVFIGRLVGEKGADILPDLIAKYLESGLPGNFLILGTGEPYLHDQFRALKSQHTGFVDASLKYDEKLAHRMYAGGDFLLMPSRVEPCGLNQMYAMAYGTLPIVRSVGGLRDTVIDISETEGYGIRFDMLSLEDSMYALQRAATLFTESAQMADFQKRAMSKDFSWDNSARQYANLYQKLR